MKKPERASLKVVAHLRDRTLIKGYTDVLPVKDLSVVLKKGSISLPQHIPLKPADSGERVSISMSFVKALFFVKSFEGHKEYKEVKFFETHPRMDGLWVRMKFYDNEMTEGLVRNSLDYLVTPGFFLKPPDPGSNNEIVYVVKASLVEFKVLGVRTTY